MRSPPSLLSRLPLFRKCFPDHLRIQSLSTQKQHFLKVLLSIGPKLLQKDNKLFLGFHCCAELTGKYKRQRLPADEGSMKSLIS